MFRRRRDTVAEPVARAASLDEFSDPIKALIAEHYAARGAFPIRVEELPQVVSVRTLIADTIAQCPLVHLGPDHRPVKNPSPIVLQPDPNDDVVTTMADHGMDLTGDGNIWMRPTVRNNYTGLPVAVEVLPADDVVPIEHPRNGRVLGCRWQGQEFSIDAGEIIHVPMYRVWRIRRRVGVSALRMSAPAMEGIAEVYGYARTTWTTAGAPSVVLRTPAPVNSKDEADAIRARWIETHGGKSVPAVLGGSATVEAFAGVDDVEKLAKAVEIIAADAPNAYRVPPSLVNAHNAGASLTYSTTTDEMRRWHRLGLSAYMRRIESLYTRLLPLGHSARFDTTELLRGDPTEQAELTSKALAGQAWRTVDEERAARGLEPLGTVAPPAPNVLPAMDGS